MKRLRKKKKTDKLLLEFQRIYDILEYNSISPRMRKEYERKQYVRTDKRTKDLKEIEYE